MNRNRLLLFVMPLFLVACSTAVNDKETIGQLRNMHVQMKEERVEDGLQKAMASYERFLQETPNSSLAPEAIRRLADLKVEQEYGVLTDDDKPVGRTKAAALPSPEAAAVSRGISQDSPSDQQAASLAAQNESEAEFEKRATRNQQVAGARDTAASSKNSIDLEKKGPLEAIKLYKKLLHDYPEYQRNDQVLYQMSRAYEELGRTEDAMQVMDKLVRGFPNSRFLDEVQFRRAEYFFIHRKYLDAEDAYSSVVHMGPTSLFYEYALYKLGWTFYKQELYEDALDKFIALLDHKVAVGYDFDQTKDETEHKRLEDTFRVISFSFSYLGGADAVVHYFSRIGHRDYEDGVYSNLAEYYFGKRRYSDATATYNAFVSRNPFHEKSPLFSMRVIEINKAGGFPSLVIDSKKEFAKKYGLQAEYWQHFKPADYPKVLGYLKTNLTDLAKHYHALYQDPKHAEDKKANFKESLHWYREFLSSFPKEKESPNMNYQLAELLLENRSFGKAAVEYEKTAYDYPRNEKSAKAGYAAVYAYRQQLDAAPEAKKDPIKKEVVRSSLKFADTFPDHEKAAVVLGAAVDDLYDMKEYEQAAAAGRKLIAKFPKADMKILRRAWLVVAHSSFELKRFNEAETAYVRVLALMSPDDKARKALVNNLAASIYKQGEQAREQKDYRAAANHFLRVGRLAPTSKIRPAAEYDAAAALIELKDWKSATTVLLKFREIFPENKLQPEVTKKIAYVYKESGQLSLAATEYERIERESKDLEVRREALLLAADLHEKTGNTARVLEVDQRYVSLFPRPVETNLETRHKIAELLKAKNDRKGYLDELRQIVAIDAAAGKDRTERTKYLAAHAALVFAQQSYERFVAVNLVKPIKVNLRKKQGLMKKATEEFGKLPDYEVGDVTAAATYYLAEIYAHFSKALNESERPEGLSPMEKEQYELAIEEQAYPFEEKAINIHEKNLELISLGIYNKWIDKSLQKLAKLVPVRYDKPEETSGIITSLDTYVFALKLPAPSEKAGAIAESTPSSNSGQDGKPAADPTVKGKTVETVKVEQLEEAVPTAGSGLEKKPKSVVEPQQAEKPVQTKEAGVDTESAASSNSGQDGKSAADTTAKGKTVETAKAEHIEKAVPKAGSGSEAKQESAPEPNQVEGGGPAKERGQVAESPSSSVPEPTIQPVSAAAATQKKEAGQSAKTEPVGESEQGREPAQAAKSASVAKPRQVEKADKPNAQGPAAESVLSSKPGQDGKPAKDETVKGKTVETVKAEQVEEAVPKAGSGSEAKQESAPEPNQVEGVGQATERRQVAESPSSSVPEPTIQPDSAAAATRKKEAGQSAKAEAVEESVRSTEQAPAAKSASVAKPRQEEKADQLKVQGPAAESVPSPEAKPAIQPHAAADAIKKKEAVRSANGEQVEGAKPGADLNTGGKIASAAESGKTPKKAQNSESSQVEKSGVIHEQEREKRAVEGAAGQLAHSNGQGSGTQQIAKP